MRLLALFCLVLCAPLHSVAASTFEITAEVGPELDTNTTRLQQTSQSSEEPILGGLMRMMSKAHLTLRPLADHFISFLYGAGAKVFINETARSADEFVQHAELGWGAKTALGVLLINGTYYDAFQRISLRDFRSGSSTAQLQIRGLPSMLKAGFNIGYRGLQYKPAPEYDFNSLRVGTALSWNLTSGPEIERVDWVLRFFFSTGLRFYDGHVISMPSRCRESSSGLFCTEEPLRQDFNHLLRVGIDYFGNADLSLWYSAELNSSNSYGETYTRHVLGLKFTAHLFWDIFLTAKGTFQFSLFRDPFLISKVSNVSFVSIDDENRSSLMIQLARDLTAHWAVHLRYSLYVNESSSQSNLSPSAEAPIFQRHTLFTGLRFEY